MANSKHVQETRSTSITKDLHWAHPVMEIIKELIMMVVNKIEDKLRPRDDHPGAEVELDEHGKGKPGTFRECAQNLKIATYQRTFPKYFLSFQRPQILRKGRNPYPKKVLKV